MKAVFDTNILIDYLNGIQQAKKEIDLYSHRLISSITWMEVLIGANEENEPIIRHPSHIQEVGYTFFQQ